MSPDDERLHAKAASPTQLTSDDDSETLADADAGTDDLGSLGRALEASASRETLVGDEAERESDVESNGDLSALASAGRVVGASSEEAVTAGGYQGGSTNAPAVRVPGAARANWLVPLLVGLGLGLASAGALFAFSGVAHLNSMALSVRASVRDATTPPAADRPASSEGVGRQPAPGERARAAVQGVPIAPSAEPAGHGDSPGQLRAQPGISPPPVPKAPPPPAGQPRPDTSTGTTATTSVRVPTAHTPAPGAVARSAPEEAAPTASGRNMDALLDEALAPPAAQQAQRERQQAALRQEALPLVPSRDDVAKSMTVLLPAIRGCTAGQSGLATATIVVRNDGRVAAVEVLGSPFGGNTSGRCMEGVIRRARFPAFQQASFRVKFPLAIQ